MHVALLTNNRFPPREGIARHVQEVATRLQARGHAVTVLARGREPRWRESTFAGLRLREFPSLGPAPFYHLPAWRALRAWIEAGADGADLLHVHLPLLPPLPKRLPIVVTVHSPMLADTAAVRGGGLQGGLKRRLMRLHARQLSHRFEAWHLGHAERVIAVSRGVQAELARDHAGCRAAVVPNGVDAGFFSFEPQAGRARTVLSVGRLGVRKGLFRLLDAFAALARTDVQLRIAGEGPFETALRARAKALGLAGRVEFLGFLDRVALRAELHAAGCFVNPADYESGPLTLLEAMAAGAPVVSTLTGLAAELGPDAPILLSPPEPETLARAIAACLDEPLAAGERARRARHLVVREHGWERVVDRLEGLYPGHRHGGRRAA